MQILDGGRHVAQAIERFESRGAAAVRLGSGHGEAHVYAVYIEPGGEIGPHEAGFDQLFVATEGAGWAAGADGRRLPIEPGQAALFRRGEIHSKGSEIGMTALMVQIEALEPIGD